MFDVNKHYASLKLKLLKFLGIPKHIAFIMDGNRRWSKQQHLPREEGHKSGFSTLTKMMESCFSLGIKHMSVYAFSADNYSRTAEEVTAIMNLALTAIDQLTVQGYLHLFIFYFFYYDYFFSTAYITIFLTY